ncbi:MAG: Metallothiol transferase FosB [Verrucomicrobiae bacterium]|nr:Metallothiol transferase FosB [Verrucomicrobiae bacterium]
MITGIMETALYVADVPRAIAFYRDVLGFELMNTDARFAAFNVAGQQVLLLFQAGASNYHMTVPGGTIPPHDGHGPNHIGFAITAASLNDWAARLAHHNVPIESRVTWPRGGASLYFRDPDNNLVELLTPGVWAIY